MKVSRSLLGVVGALVLFTSVASADVSDLLLAIQICDPATGTCIGTYDIYTDDPNGNGWWEGETYHWELVNPINILDAQNNTLATLENNGTNLELHNDPQVNFGFAVTAGAVDAEFSMYSALVSFPTINSPEGRASVAYSVTDNNFDGATLTGVDPDTHQPAKSYRAQYNTFPNGTAFTDLIDGLSATPGSSAGTSAEDPIGVGNYTPIGVPVSNISARVAFTLTAGDFASGTSTFEVIPEPASLLLLVASFGLIRRR